MVSWSELDLDRGSEGGPQLRNDENAVGPRDGAEAPRSDSVRRPAGSSSLQGKARADPRLRAARLQREEAKRRTREDLETG